MIFGYIIRTAVIQMGDIADNHSGVVLSVCLRKLVAFYPQKIPVAPASEKAGNDWVFAIFLRILKRKLLYGANDFIVFRLKSYRINLRRVFVGTMSHHCSIFIGSNF